MSIIYFDGVCNLCNHFVDFVLKYDKNDVLLFSSLQGKSAKTHLSESDLSLDSVVLYENGMVYKKSAAVSKVLKKLKMPYNIIGYIYGIIPFFIADVIYDVVAKNRYKLFGKKETCRLPTANERKRFLD